MEGYFAGKMRIDIFHSSFHLGDIHAELASEKLAAHTHKAQRCVVCVRQLALSSFMLLPSFSLLSSFSYRCWPHLLQGDFHAEFVGTGEHLLCGNSPAVVHIEVHVHFAKGAHLLACQTRGTRL